MNIRESLTEKPGRGLAVAGALLLVGVTLGYFQLRGGDVPTSKAEAFFTIDDGKSWFADDASKLPPFQKDGKDAVLAHVYKGTDGTTFVNHLERMTPDAVAQIQAASKSDGDPHKTHPDYAAQHGSMLGGREVKRPGEATWINISDRVAFTKVTAIKSPKGDGNATPVTP